jgi:hypothetical protein
VITPLPPSFNIIAALAGHISRMPSNAPAAAAWIYNPTFARISYDQREDQILTFLNHFYDIFPQELVAIWRAEAAGLLPSEALYLFSTHLDDWYPKSFLNRR